jgi:hypothetical protein
VAYPAPARPQRRRNGWALNDPFGSWVWNRIPLAAVDRIEVVRGHGDL